MFHTFLNRMLWMSIGAILGVAGMSDIANTIATGIPDAWAQIVTTPVGSLSSGFGFFN